MNPRPYTLPTVDGLQSKSRKADKPVGTLDPAMQPVIILLRPQLPENVGMAARAMLNCGLTQLRVVAPTFEWPNQTAFNASSGADQVLRSAQKFDTLADAISDLQMIYATSPRNHHLNLPVVMMDDAAREIVEHLYSTPPMRGSQNPKGILVGGDEKGKSPPKNCFAISTLPQGEGSRGLGILFGPERAGLQNDDIAVCNKILTIPLQRDFNSLNLSQAVLLIGYAIFSEMARLNPEIISPRGHGEHVGIDDIAPRGELDEFLKRLIGLLDEGGFLKPPEKRPSMVDNLTVLFTRMGLSSQEIKTLHGVVTTLVKMDKN